MTFEVSVIIPVFNCEQFIERAILSVVTIDCVKEIIVVDDGSHDTSFKKCQQLASLHQTIRVISHPGHINKGVSATRNLGIKNAKSKFIAFLDADDYYLPVRFEKEKELFSKHKDFEGAYGAVEWIENGKSKLYTITEEIKPSELFKTLLWHNKGLFHTNAITIKKELLNRIGYFDEKMSVAEDTELWYRIAAFGKIYTGNIQTPISRHIIHGNNLIISAKDKYYSNKHYLYSKMIKSFLFSSKIDYNNKNELIIVFNHYQYLFKKVYSETLFIIRLLLRFPILLFCPYIYHKTLQLIKLSITKNKSCPPLKFPS